MISGWVATQAVGKGKKTHDSNETYCRIANKAPQKNGIMPTMKNIPPTNLRPEIPNANRQAPARNNGTVSQNSNPKLPVHTKPLSATTEQPLYT